ncbi:hypothetical protein K439DRAFT_1622310 [Ramaria rubella]|nr:hypothetical protein K439DRAFT_1622310 [Ramaria rubella]
MAQTPLPLPSSSLLSSPALTSLAHSSLAVTVSLTTPQVDSSTLTLPVISEPISDTPSDEPTIRTLYETQLPVPTTPLIPGPASSETQTLAPTPKLSHSDLPMPCQACPHSRSKFETPLHDTLAVPDQAIYPSAVPSPSNSASTPPNPAPAPCPPAASKQPPTSVPNVSDPGQPSSAATHVGAILNANPLSSCSTSPALFTVPMPMIPNLSSDQNSLLADNMAYITVITDNPGSKAKFQPTKSSSAYRSSNLFSIDYIVMHPGATRGTVRAAFESDEAVKNFHYIKFGIAREPGGSFLVVYGLVRPTLFTSDLVHFPTPSSNLVHPRGLPYALVWSTTPLSALLRLCLLWYARVRVCSATPASALVCPGPLSFALV